MQEKAFTLINKGMNRDLSISKAGESSAYENHNIRIIARDQDTLLSVTNERGNKMVVLGENLGIYGKLIGWNVLNNHIILFTHDPIAKDSTNINVASRCDRIYRIDYNGKIFEMAVGKTGSRRLGIPLFYGNLNFDLEHPIESVVYHETEDIQKIYWVDGKNVLRFMNFMSDVDTVANWDADGNKYEKGGVATCFDTNKRTKFNVSASITKDNSGNTRANGIVQYVLTYYDKHGAESGYVWVSDIVYLSPTDKGGAADGTNSNKVTIELSDLDLSYSSYRLYSIFRSSLNAQPVAYIVSEGEMTQKWIMERVISGDIEVSGGGHMAGYILAVDDGSHLVTEDVQRLLYLGSQELVPGTLTYKDQTLFLGDMQSIGKSDYTELEAAIRTMYDEDSGLSNAISFQLSEFNDSVIGDIPYHADTGAYEYDSQLNYTSSQILSFKGGEKYRFAITFRRKDGTSTEAFWIGDAENTLYPVVDVVNNTLKRIVAKCELPDAVITAMTNAGFETAQLMIAEATYADRSVKAQGILNPTMFNVWDRYNKRLYAQSSWISRPRNSGFAYKHFEPVHNSTSSTGEIDCNYWETESAPTPYYRLNGDTYIDNFDGISAGDYRMILYSIQRSGAYYWAQVWLFSADLYSDSTSGLFSHTFTEEELNWMIENGEADGQDFNVSLVRTDLYQSPTKTNSADSLYPLIKSACKEQLGLNPTLDVITESQFRSFCNSVGKGQTKVFNSHLPGSIFASVEAALNTYTGWENPTETAARTDVNYVPSFYRKHLMFVDENVVTLNSPEITYEAVSFDNAENYGLRIVGVARITNTVGDYTVNATPGKLPGENLIREKFVGDTDGIISWPLWKEYGLKKKKGTSDNPITIPTNYKRRTSEHYDWLEDPVIYWLHMWNHSGKINGYTDSDGSDYSRLNSKVFANLRYSYNTIYNKDNSKWVCGLSQGALRLFNYTSSQYTGLKVGGETTFYNANIQQSLMTPGTHKYKVLYHKYSPSVNEGATGELSYLYLDAPVQLDYLSSPHAVIELASRLSGNTYTQTVLPYINSNEAASVPSTAVLPWRDGSNVSYSLSQEKYSLTAAHNHAGSLASTDKYLLIGEIYYDFTGNDTRYGDVRNNRFITAGPQYTLSELKSKNVMYANQGDTYFQRWDCLKTKPYETTDATNSVIDITSVLLETHINIDGRTDNQRETGYIASIDTEKYGQLNPVYTQQNNFFAQRDLDEDFNADSYRSSITWSLEKTDSAEIDEWSHVTLASSIKLDGDKGVCRALRRFQNSIISFQDKGIAEILFNSRTQLSTTDGVPVELANSGKVDGKRYISNKFGCVNKWSITEGKSALYFVDNINKAFCAFNGQIEPLSTRLGFDVWFRRNNTLEPWNPKTFNNIVSFYDRIHSDVYLVRNENDDEPCLVYNETLGAFTSFFDYGSVPMMVNVDDRFISFKGNNLWLQNEGLYCNFFGSQFDFWTNYRVTPDPYGDKIWSNIDYRADFYQVLDSEGHNVQKEKELITADAASVLIDEYKENETFTSYKVWNEYQTTGYVLTSTNTSRIDPVRKKFRIWRLAIPRALKHDTNRHGLDRIRNPWVNVEFRKKVTDNKLLMQLHDIVIKYFE